MMDVPTAPDVSEQPENHSGMPHADHIARQIRPFLSDATTRSLREEVEFKDTRPQHEGQRGGSFRVRVDVTDAPVADVAALGALAEKNDYEMAIHGDRETVVLTVHETRYPVYGARLTGAGRPVMDYKGRKR